MENKAAYLLAIDTPLSIEPAPFTEPGPNEVVVRNHAIAINPIDLKQQTTGVLIKEFPYVMGMDISGTIVEVGSSITAFKKGDRVAAVTPALLTENKANAGFQLYTVLSESVVSHIPDNVPLTSAAVLPLGVTTAANGLFSPENMGLEPPSASATSVTEGNGENLILIWGGSSSVGSCAIQICAVAGYTILSTASPRNFDYITDLGTTQVFDCNDPDVASKLTQAARGKKIVGAFDAIGDEATTVACAQFLHTFGGAKVYATQALAQSPQLPEDVVRVYTRASTVGADGGPPLWLRVWADFMGEGLKNGKLRAKPEPYVLKGGLEKLQEGLDLMRQGVSRTKIVVQLAE